eukprot:TRINITY_DN27497_c0_g1_i1.p1 TRINITY_DN27497_c0_g1~~TRINITY_DN27497_c0_g1_i1.p1  ORF type:complete len:721 (+),score=206.37 TRINITY_DN27497_c0_g1_i1:128-2164(+)
MELPPAAEAAIERDPGGDPAPPSRARAAAALALDLGTAAAHFAEAREPQPETVRGEMLRRSRAVLDELRDVELSDNWESWKRCKQLALAQGFAGLREDAGDLYNESVEDAVRRTESRLHRWKDELVEEYGEPAGRLFRCSRLFNDLVTQPTAKKQAFCMWFWVVFIIVWELSIWAIRRPAGCAEGVSANGARELQQCVDVGRLAGAINCSEYRCAVPWLVQPGGVRCSSCNCGGTCDQCRECICAIGFGPGQHHVCMDYSYFPGSWATAVRWAVVALAGFFGVLVLLKWLCTWYLDHRQNVIVQDALAAERLKKRRLQQMRDLRAHILGTDVPYERPLIGIYRQGMVRAALAQRLQQERAARLPAPARGEQLLGEPTGAMADIAEDLAEDLHRVTRSAAAAPTHLPARVGYDFAAEERRQRPSPRSVYGGPAGPPPSRAEIEAAFAGLPRQRRLWPLSRLRRDLGDDWLRELSTEPLRRGQLYEVFVRAAAGEQTASAARLAAELEAEPGVHASRPYLRAALLSRQGGVRERLTWAHFHDEVCAARDFIADAGAGVFQFAGMGDQSRRWRKAAKVQKRPGTMEALSAAAAELAPLLGLGGGGADDASSAAESADKATCVAGAAPYLVALLRGYDPPTKREAERQAAAILDGLTAAQRLFSSQGGGDDSGEECSSESAG